MSEALVRVERSGPVATLVLNDPERRNAMSEAMGIAFSEQVADLSREADLRALIVTGAGSAFSGGGDLEMLEARAAQAQAEPVRAQLPVRDAMRRYYGLFLSLRELPCPSIAAINGHAIGAGLGVALACDLRIAAESAKLGLNFTRLGLHPGMGITWTLPRLIGTARAAELLFTGGAVDGREASAMGMVNRALPAEEVLPAAQELAAEISRAAPLAVAGVKRALERSPDASLADQLGFEAEEQARGFASQDLREGLDAAAKRREPRFRGV